MAFWDIKKPKKSDEQYFFCDFLFSFQILTLYLRSELM